MVAAPKLYLTASIRAGNGRDATTPSFGGNGGSVHIDDDIAKAEFKSTMQMDLRETTVIVPSIVDILAGKGGTGFTDVKSQLRADLNGCHSHGSGVELRGTEGGNGGDVFLTPDRFKFEGHSELIVSAGDGGRGGGVVGSAAGGSVDHAGSDVFFTTGSGGASGSSTVTQTSSPEMNVQGTLPGSPGSAQVGAGSGGSASAGFNGCDGGNVTGTFGKVGRAGTPVSKVTDATTAAADFLVGAGEGIRAAGGPGTLSGAQAGGHGGDVTLDGGGGLRRLNLDVRVVSSGGAGAGTCETNPVGGAGGSGGTLNLTATLKQAASNGSTSIVNSFNGGAGGADQGSGGLPGTKGVFFDGIANSFQPGPTGPSCPRVGILIINPQGGSTTITPPGATCHDRCFYAVAQNLEEDAVAQPDSSHLFGGWATGPCQGSMNPECHWKATQDTTLTPNWTATSHELTVSVTGSGSVAGGGISCPTTCLGILPTGSALTLTAQPASGWSFRGWSGACSGIGTCTVTMSQDQFVFATFIPKLTVAITGDGSGSVDSTPSGIRCPSACSWGFDLGTGVTLTPHADAGSVFLGWSGACTGQGTCTLAMNGPTTAGAQFVKLYSVTINVNGAGTVTDGSGAACRTTCTFLYGSNTLVTLTATPDPGQVFGGWSGDCTGLRTCIVPANSPKTVVANFTPAPSVPMAITIVGQSGNGVSGSPSPVTCFGNTCTGTAPSGTVETFTALPGSSETFVGWIGLAGCAQAPTCTQTVLVPINLTAQFAP